MTEKDSTHATTRPPEEAQFDSTFAETIVGGSSSRVPQPVGVVLQCPTCRANYNVVNRKPGREVECPTCKVPLAPPPFEATIDAAVSTEGAQVDVRDLKGRPFGRYRLREEVGKGGMGVVWKAWDTELKRIVALKQILPERAGPEWVERFLREAQSAARLRHPSIVAIHDVGVIDGQHYLTCDLVEGASLEAMLEAPVPVRRAVEIARAVADALAAAHAQGIVHRDVKPANVLVDAAGRAYVTDFGLAKDVKDTHRAALTTEGDLVGSPAYMSPEQAVGMTEGVGPASDQFSLGVVLYQLLTGRRPFDAPAIPNLLRAIQENDPLRPSLANPRVHRDLETVCLRALEKSPERRYPSAAEMAADLGRWLDGEPIHARPVGPIGRLARKAARHKVVASIVVTAAVVSLGAGVFALVAGRHAGETEAAAEELLAKSRAVSKVFARWSQLAGAVRDLEGTFYDSTLSPAEARSRAEAPWKRVEAFLRETPPDGASQAAALALAGFARSLAGEPKEAQSLFDRATAADADVPYGALLDALAVFAAYLDQQQMPTVTTTGAGLAFAPAPGETEEMHHGRERIETLLRSAERCRIWGREGADDFASAIAGLRAMQAGRLAEAEEALSRALAGPDLRAFETGLLLARSHVRYLRKSFDAALDDLDPVLRVRAASGGAWFFRGEVLCGKACEAAWRGGDPRAALRDAIDSFDRSLRVAPGSSSARNSRAVAWCALADDLVSRGEDPSDAFTKGIEDYDAAILVRPSLPEAYMNRGNAWQRFGRWQASRGQDPRPAIQRAINDCSTALRIDATLGDAHNNRGIARMDLADADAARGVDPREVYAGAIEDFERAFARDPKNADAEGNRGGAWLGVAEAEGRRGVDPRASYAKAIEAYDRALVVRPESPNLRNSRGACHRSLADALSGMGEDPRKEIEAAIADFDESIRGNARLFGAWVNRATARFDLAEAEAARGGDPQKAYDEAIEDFDQAALLNPEASDVPNNRGLVRKAIGRWQEAHGEDPREAYDAAIADFEAALTRNPRSADARANLALVRIAIGDAAGARGEDPRPSYEKAIEDCDEVLDRNPENASTYNTRAIAWASIGDYEAARKGDPSQAYGRAIADFGKVLEKNPGYAAAYRNRGSMRANLAQSIAAAGKDPRPTYQEAIADFGEALKRNPAYVAAFVARGDAWRAIGDADVGDSADAPAAYAKARADYESAQKVRGARDPAVDAKIERLPK